MPLWSDFSTVRMPTPELKIKSVSNSSFNSSTFYLQSRYFIWMFTFKYNMPKTECLKSPFYSPINVPANV